EYPTAECKSKTRLVRLCLATRRGLKANLRFAEGCRNIREPLAKRYLTTGYTLYLCIENLSEEDGRCVTRKRSGLGIYKGIKVKQKVN
ncbi:hypothetical protein, partial [Bacteroides acidifaciens]|uniref:hypothetical protein n=1 Tax=Bacteroides acidifaciens TaxID=85831 RepID=UPI003EBF6A7D